MSFFETLYYLFSFFFFFSSRRRHTRYIGDWSSDVCSSDLIAGAGRHVAVYLDEQINLEVGVELAAPFGGHGEVTGSVTPSGPVAATTHYGPYGLLHQAHEAIRRWCRSHGQVLAGPSWEIYGHWQDE